MSATAISATLLADAKENTRQIRLQIKMECSPMERRRLQAELKEANKLVREARKYA